VRLVYVIREFLETREFQIAEVTLQFMLPLEMRVHLPDNRIRRRRVNSEFDSAEPASPASGKPSARGGQNTSRDHCAHGWAAHTFTPQRVQNPVIVVDSHSVTSQASTLFLRA